MRVKIRSTDADPGPGGGNETPHLGHQDDQGNLPDIGRLSGHVGTGNDEKAILLQIEEHVIGNETRSTGHPLHHRMAAVGDFDGLPLIDHGAAVVVPFGHLGKRRERVEIGDP